MADKREPNVEIAWVRLVRAHTIVLSGIEKALKRQKLPPLSWYDALLEIERAGDSGLRPGELERHLLLPQYGTSRLLARLENEGFVGRKPCPDDARGHNVAITASGKALRARMWPIYCQAMNEFLGANLAPDETERLSALLGHLVDSNGKSKSGRP